MKSCDFLTIKILSNAAVSTEYMVLRNAMAMYDTALGAVRDLSVVLRKLGAIRAMPQTAANHSPGSHRHMHLHTASSQ